MDVDERIERGQSTGNIRNSGSVCPGKCSRCSIRRSRMDRLLRELLVNQRTRLRHDETGSSRLRPLGVHREFWSMDICKWGTRVFALWKLRHAGGCSLLQLSWITAVAQCMD